LFDPLFWQHKGPFFALHLLRFWTQAILGEPEGRRVDGETVGIIVGGIDGDPDGGRVGEFDGKPDGKSDCFSEGTFEGIPLGSPLGDPEGEPEDITTGMEEGRLDGKPDATSGAPDGEPEAMTTAADGPVDGEPLIAPPTGLPLGERDGPPLGTEETVGLLVGAFINSYVRAMLIPGIPTTTTLPSDEISTLVPASAPASPTILVPIRIHVDGPVYSYT
jgi:hypothetical protein